VSQTEYSNPIGAPDDGLQPGFEAQPAPRPKRQKQRLSIYTMLLILSFFAMVTASILLQKELMRFGETDWWKTNQYKPNVTATSTP